MMMEYLLQIALPCVIAVLGSGGMWSYLDHRKAERTAAQRQETEEERAQRNIVRALARIELVRVSLSHIEAGNITMEEADALTELFEPYEVLGGNGNGKRLYEQAMALPRRTGRENAR